MISQKSCIENPHGGGWFNRELKFLGLFLALISFSNLIFSNNTSALFTPTLSASVNQANLQVNGNQVINSTDKTTEIPFNFTVNTNNRTGYTVILNSETENTALTNTSSTTGAKIDSVNSNLTLNNLPNNTWGYKIGSSTNYAPIPALSTPAQIIQTAGKTNGNESSQLSIGMKLADNLESGNYTNKLILSFVSNPYIPKATMMRGLDFHSRIARFDSNPGHVNGHPEIPTYPNIVHIKRERNTSNIPTGAINIEADNSEAEIKAWFDLATKTVYWYSVSEKVYLNPDCANMFTHFTGMTDIDLSSFDTSEVEDMNSVFYFNFALEKLDVSKFDTSRVRIMREMFDNCSSLKELDVSNFNTSNVENMRYMFYNVNKMKKLNLSHFDTGNVRDMEGMFAEMASLESLNLSNFNTGRVVNMRNMFYGATSLQSLDLSNFNTKNVVDMYAMFYHMPSLKTLNVSSFNTENVENMANMFTYADSLEELDLSSFKTPKVKAFRMMFYTNRPEANKMRRIYASSDFDISTAVAFSATDPLANIEIFGQMKNLVGGNGTRSANNSTPGIYLLKIDRPGVPGLFTRKP